MRTKDRFRSDPFTDLLFNALLGFTFLFLVAIMFMNPEAKTGIIDPKAEYILTITWEDNSPDDIDVWVEDPEGQLVYFRATEAGLLHLDRDDRGLINDTITIVIHSRATHAWIVIAGQTGLARTINTRFINRTSTLNGATTFVVKRAALSVEGVATLDAVGCFFASTFIDFQVTMHAYTTD